MRNSAELEGKKFGKWTLIRPSTDKRKWVCECECGTVKDVRLDRLKSGDTTSCGCQRALFKESNMLEGKRFGNIIVIGKAETGSRNIYWECQCDCGEVFKATTSRIKSGRITSCSKCSAAKRKINEPVVVSGKRFGKLVAISPTNEKRYRSRVWLCQCDCGYMVHVASRNLCSGNTISCGCIKESTREKAVREILTQNNYKFEKEKKFDSCRFHDSGRRASFDFYVEGRFLIEVDGAFHFRPFGKAEKSRYGKKAFEKIVEHDRFKNEWCKKNNIPLIRLPYTLKEIMIGDLMPETSRYLVKS